MSPRISVIVPMYNVADYVDECLESLVRQTMRDLEVVIVDDGSTDDSAAHAEAFVARDPRFRLLRHPNGGLGKARNIGIDAAVGEYLAFVDSDDVVAPRAYETLLASLDASGSDFASGNVRRLTSYGLSQAAFLADVFQRSRVGTHITKFPALIADRTAWNKLFRRSFWDAHSLRFPEGMLYEDMPVTVPAHYLADAVDVVDRVVYYWRVREGGDQSITQQRTDLRAMRDRARAVDSVSRFLAQRGLDTEKRAYDTSVLREDLRYFLDVLGFATEEFHTAFLDLANDYLDRAAPDVAATLPAIQRLKWLLVRRRALPELLEVLDFQETALDRRPPVRQGNQWSGDYPLRTDRRLAIPAETYRLDGELAPVAGLSDLGWADDGTLVVTGHAYIEMLGAPHERSQQVLLVVSGKDGEVGEVPAASTHRPDVTADATQAFASLDWAGFEARIPAAMLPPASAAPPSVRLSVDIRNGDVRRRTAGWEWPAAHPARTVTRTARGRSVRARLNPAGELEISAAPDRAAVTACRWLDGVLQVEGRLHPSDREGATLTVSRRGGTGELTYPLHVDAVRASASTEWPAFLGRVPVDDLLREVDPADRATGGEGQSDGVAWEFSVTGKTRRRMTMPDTVEEGRWPHRDREIVVERSRFGYLSVLDRSPRPVITGADWTNAGELVLTGSAASLTGQDVLVLHRRRGSEEHVVPLDPTDDDGGFRCLVGVRHLDAGLGGWSLAPGRWDLAVRSGPDGPEVAAVVEHALLDALPVATTLDAQPVRFGVSAYDVPLLVIGRDLDEADRGGYHQRLLVERAATGRRRGGLRDAVLYLCSSGASAGGSPRAIHDELVRRGSDLEQLWVVRDHRVAPPPTARAVRADSAEFYEALARSRFVVGNDYWPEAFERRRGQTCLQTWHGTSIKRQGEQLADRPVARRSRRPSAQQRPTNWQLLLSPSPAVTPLLREAFPYAGDVLETGLPRADLVRRLDTDATRERVRVRLGIRPDRRLVLYAPTYRDQLKQGRTRFRLGAMLDIAVLHERLGNDWAVLFRRHPAAIGRLPVPLSGDEPFVYDVSEHGVVEDLLAAADVVVTDYSALAVDQVSRGRPVLFFVPDLETYRDDVRGLAIPLDQTAPGPLLRTTADVAEALLDLDGVRARCSTAFAAFAASYCSLDDGGASARVVDAVFGR